MTQEHTTDKTVEILEALYALSGVSLLFLFGSAFGIQVPSYGLDRQLCAVVLVMIGSFQLLAIWITTKEILRSTIIMSLLSSVAILALLLFIPVLGQGEPNIVAALYLMCVLNIVNLGLLSQESITSKLLHRQISHYNDEPVLLLVLLHVSYGCVLFSLIEFLLPIIASSLTTLGLILLYSIWTTSALLILAIPFFILRQKYAWILLFVLDIAVLIMCLVSGILTIQQPDVMVSPWAQYREYRLRECGEIALMGILFGILPCAVLVGSLPALDTDEKAVNARRNGQEKAELPMQK